MKKMYNGKVFYTCTECDRFITVENYLKVKDTPMHWIEQGDLHICSFCKTSKKVATSLG